MAKKTVISRACKNFINSSDDANLTEAFENTTENENVDIAVVDVQHEIETQANTEELRFPLKLSLVRLWKLKKHLWEKVNPKKLLIRL